MLQDILIVERVVGWYNTLADATDYTLVQMQKTQPYLGGRMTLYTRKSAKNLIQTTNF